LENRVAIPAFRDATSIDKNQRFSLQSSRFVTLFSPKAPLLPSFLKVSGTEKNLSNLKDRFNEILKKIPERKLPDWDRI